MSGSPFTRWQRLRWPAPLWGGHAAQIIGPAGLAQEERGTGTNTQYVYNTAMARDLLVTGVFTRSGH